jgi:hypothetical protein
VRQIRVLQQFCALLPGKPRVCVQPLHHALREHLQLQRQYLPVVLSASWALLFHTLCAA